MEVTQFTRDALAFRREKARLSADGFQCTFDFDWRLTRGGLTNKRIAEVQISADGKQVWYRLEDDPARKSHQPSAEYLAA